MADPLPEKPPIPTTRALLIHLLGENQRLHDRLDALAESVKPPPKPKWYWQAMFWVLDWRSTIVAAVAMIPWKGKQQ